MFNREMDGPTFTSVFQVRFNTFVALALAENMFGADGLFLAAMGAGFMILLINVLCVVAFSLTVNNGGRMQGGTCRGTPCGCLAQVPTDEKAAHQCDGRPFF